MGRFLYFLPGLTGSLDAGRIKQQCPGLRYALSGPSVPARGCSGGPNGGEGLLAAYGESGGLDYQPATQTWCEMAGVAALAGGGRPWLGFETASPPGPGDLLREVHCTENHPVTLGDGNSWGIPVVRRYPNGTALPQVIVLGKRGPEARIKREYEALYQLAVALAEDLYGEPATLLDSGKLLCMASLALSVNYRLGPDEISALELLDTQNVQEIAKALIDTPRLMKLWGELQKKTAGISTSGAALCPGGNVP